MDVNRNRGRFPEDFMFQLCVRERDNLRFQFGISSWGGRRYLPVVFTEQGVAMLSSMLNSERAVRVNIEIMRAFVRLAPPRGGHLQAHSAGGQLTQRPPMQAPPQ